MPLPVRVVLLAVAILFLTASPASAHAVLISSSPGDGANLDVAPSDVRLEFNEPVSLDLGAVRVFDADGERVDEGAATVDGGVVEVGLRPDLGDGAYVVSYRVVSTDAHPVNGGFIFTVGDSDAGDVGSLEGLLDDDGDQTWERVGLVGRWIAYAGTLAAAGIVAFLVLAHDGGAERRSLRRLAGIAALVGAAGMLVALPVQAALGTGQGAGSLFDDGVLSAVLSGGVGAATVTGILGLVLAWAFVERSRVVVLAGAALAAESFAFAGHTRVGDVAAIATLGDSVHLVAGAVWFGGLVALLLTIRARRADGTSVATVAGRFATVATAAIVAVGLAGLALSWAEVRTVSALTSTTYGRLLIAKVAVVTLVAAAGAFNHFRVVPVLGATSASTATRANRMLRRTVGAEVAGVVVALALTSFLVVETPAREAAGGGIVDRTVELGEYGSVQIVVDPAQAGRNAIHLYLYGPDGRPAEIAEDLTLELRKPADDIGPIIRTPVRAGPSHYQHDGDELVSSGLWTITVVARISQFEQTEATAEVPISP